MQVPQRRAIVLGASNVALGLDVLVGTARHVWGEPLDLLTANGHGRSYGLTSRVMGRALPSILQCPLWDEWRDRAPLPTAALLTDIGNDILFGVSPTQIASWVRTCLTRLREPCDRLAMTELPLDSVLGLGPYRFLALRYLLFPSSRITWDQASSRTRELNERLVDLGREWNVTMVRPIREWYGWDPIHVLPSSRPDAWRKILTAWGGSGVKSLLPHSRRPEIQWWNTRPKSRTLFGVRQQRAQPALRLADGSHVSLY